MGVVHIVLRFPRFFYILRCITAPEMFFLFISWLPREHGGLFFSQRVCGVRFLLKEIFCIGRLLETSLTEYNGFLFVMSDLTWSHMKCCCYLWYFVCLNSVLFSPVSKSIKLFCFKIYFMTFSHMWNVVLRQPHHLFSIVVCKVFLKTSATSPLTLVHSMSLTKGEKFAMYNIYILRATKCLSICVLTFVIKNKHLSTFIKVLNFSQQCHLTGSLSLAGIF